VYSECTVRVGSTRASKGTVADSLHLIQIRSQVLAGADTRLRVVHHEHGEHFSDVVV
jgi:hypothetical protein